MKPLIGLALGAGVARGWAHIGVLKALEEAGCKPDIVAGTSIGALVGGAYLGGHLPALEGWARRLNRARLSRMFDFKLGGSSVIAGRRVLQAFHPELSTLRIEDLPVPFACVATDLATGHEVWLRNGDLVEALRASYALPGIFPPLKIDGRWLIDGALANPVPVSVCRALGSRLTIAVNLNGEAIGEVSEDIVDSESNGHTIGDSGIQDEAMPSRIKQLRRLLRRPSDEPGVFTVMARSLHIVQDRIARSRLGGDPPDVMIFPSVADIGILEFHRASEIIAAGEAATRAVIPKIRALVRRLENGRGPWDYRRRTERRAGL